MPLPHAATVLSDRTARPAAMSRAPVIGPAPPGASTGVGRESPVGWDPPIPRAIPPSRSGRLAARPEPQARTLPSLLSAYLSFWYDAIALTPVSGLGGPGARWGNRMLRRRESRRSFAPTPILARLSWRQLPALPPTPPLPRR